MVVLNLNDGLYHHPATLQDVEDFCIGADVEHDVFSLILHLIQLLVDLDELNEAPGLEVRQ